MIFSDIKTAHKLRLEWLQLKLPDGERDDLQYLDKIQAMFGRLNNFQNDDAEAELNLKSRTGI